MYICVGINRKVKLKKKKRIRKARYERTVSDLFALCHWLLSQVEPRKIQFCREARGRVYEANEPADIELWQEGRNNKEDRKDLRQDLRTKLVYTSDKRVSLPSTIADDRARPYSAINIVI